jgi:hypothetical protein
MLSSYTQLAGGGLKYNFKAYILEVLGSKVGQDMSILTEVSHGFPRCLQANEDIVLTLGHEHIVPNPFQFTVH